MKIGVCCGIENWKTVAECGYDYIEGRFSWLCELTDADFHDAESKLASIGLHMETLNAFFASGILLYKAEQNKLRDIMRRGFERAARLGAEIAVVGSGTQRKAQDGMSVNDAEHRFADILHICGEEAQRVGMIAAVEPLRRQETNVVNTLPEAHRVCGLAAHPAVGMIVDFFHFYENGETLDELDIVKDKLVHAHLARPNDDRFAPGEEDLPVLRAWAEKLYRIGYKGRISMECSWGDRYEEGLRTGLPVMNVFRKAAEGAKV